LCAGESDEYAHLGRTIFVSLLLGGQQKWILRDRKPTERCKVAKNISLKICNLSTRVCYFYRSESQKYRVVSLELHVNIPQSGEAGSASSNHSSSSSPVGSIQGLYRIIRLNMCTSEWTFGTSVKEETNCLVLWNMLQILNAEAVSSVFTPLTWKSILILLFHICLGLPNGLFQNFLCIYLFPITCYMACRSSPSVLQIRQSGR
jgi:hypothetical protein